MVCMRIVNTLHIAYGHEKSADLHIAYPITEAFALPYRTNKQQETYADMTAYYPVALFAANIVAPTSASLYNHKCAQHIRAARIV